MFSIVIKLGIFLPYYYQIEFQSFIHRIVSPSFSFEIHFYGRERELEIIDLWVCI